MMPDWQTILDLYLQGEGSRAEVESLRLRLHLSRTDRDEIEAALRLVDELEHAKVLALPAAGAEDRLRERLREHVAEHPLPSQLSWLSESGQHSSALRLGIAGGEGAEDAANSVIEGTALTISGSGVSEELKQFQEIASAFDDPSAPPIAPSPGAQERLVARLREFQNSETGALDPAVDRRLSRQIQSATMQPQRRPDLKAATIDENETPPSEGG